MGKMIRALKYAKIRSHYKHLDELKFFYQGKQFMPGKKLFCTLIIIMSSVADNNIFLTFD